MTAIKLSPVDVNYLTSSLVYQNLTQNNEVVELANDISASSTPKIVLNGSGMAQINGSVTVDASPVPNMTLCHFPSNISTKTTNTYPVVVLRSGAVIQNAIQVTESASAIASVTVTTPGSYSVVPTVTTSGPGFGAVLQARVGAITPITTTIGSGYVVGDTITAAGGTFITAAVLTVTTTELASTVLNAAGSGYIIGERIELAGGTWVSAAVLEVTGIGGGGTITTFIIYDGGSYTSNTATFTQFSSTGSGTGATFHTSVFGVNIVSTTNGLYTAIPTNPVSQASTSGSGTGFMCNLGWEVVDVLVNVDGEGYTNTSQVVFTPTSAAATLLLTNQHTTEVVLLNQPTIGDIVCLDTPQFLLNAY